MQGDLISRQAVIDIVDSYSESRSNVEDVTQDIISDIVALPPVTPKEKTGQWIVHPKGIYAHLICDNCLSNAPYDCRTNYCPDCGTKMVEPQESEVEE